MKNITILRRPFLVFMLCCLSLAVWAGDLEDGVTAAKAADFSRAFRLWKPLAEQGNADAQNYMGQLYANGWHVSMNYGKAIKWYRKSAAQGHANAHANLGYMYEQGMGVIKDPAKAVEFYRKAAEMGDVGGQTNLGNMYEYGLGVKKNHAKALEWYRKAAEQGDQEASRRAEHVKSMMSPEDALSGEFDYTNQSKVGKIYTFDIKITDEYANLGPEKVVIFDIPYSNLRTTGAIIQIYYSVGVVGKAQWFLLDGYDGAIIMPSSIHIPLGKWIASGLRKGYILRVVLLTGINT